MRRSIATILVVCYLAVAPACFLLSAQHGAQGDPGMTAHRHLGAPLDADPLERHHSMYGSYTDAEDVADRVAIALSFLFLAIALLFVVGSGALVPASRHSFRSRAGPAPTHLAKRGFLAWLSLMEASPNA